MWFSYLIPLCFLSPHVQFWAVSLLLICHGTVQAPQDTPQDQRCQDLRGCPGWRGTQEQPQLQVPLWNQDKPTSGQDVGLSEPGSLAAAVKAGYGKPSEMTANTIFQSFVTNLNI